jgi:hypothetical protein
MCLAPDGVDASEAHAKAILLLTAQLDRWRGSLAIHSPGKRKTDAEVFRAYLTSRHDRGGFEPIPRPGR